MCSGKISLISALPNDVDFTGTETKIDPPDFTTSSSDFGLPRCSKNSSWPHCMVKYSITCGQIL